MGCGRICKMAIAAAKKKSLENESYMGNFMKDGRQINSQEPSASHR
jgi:hypothetical protein